MTTMICLVSRQPMPNLRPILCKMPDFGIKKVVLVVSPVMGKEAERLEKVLDNHKIPHERLLIKDVYDMPGLRGQFARLMSGRDETCLVNLTGGTKIMSMALWRETLQSPGCSAFYIREDNHQGIWLDENKNEFKIMSRMSLDDIFDAHGYERQDKKRHQASADRIRMGDWLLKKYYDRPDLINALNKASHIEIKKEKKNTRVEKKPGVDYAALGEILEYAENLGFLKKYDDHLLFPAKDKRKFICGGWLEYAVFSVIKEIRQEQSFIDDVAIGFNIRNWGEMDVLVSRSRGLAVIECKTAAYTKQTREIDVINQTASQGRYGGLTTVNILVSLTELKNPPALQRAKDENIHIIDGSKLGSLKEHLIGYLK